MSKVEHIEPDSLDDLLKKLLAAIPEVKAAAIVSSEGLPIFSTLPGDIDETKIAAMISVLWSLANGAITEIQNGDFEQLYIKSSKGYLLIRQLTPDAILIVSADKDVRLGPFFQGDPYPYIFNPPNPPDDPDGEVQVSRVMFLNEEENLFFCKHCGAPLDEGVSLCPNCKKKI
jgi:predicted regulator of Ras-like GTPase activity (Roadblock/LC7/MglB family)